MENEHFDLNRLKSTTSNNNRYEKRIAKLESKSFETSHIKFVVENSIANLKNKHSSFVIYGEPQSGKTEMMIALTARLLDEGYKIVFVLLNDSVQLLDQNLDRFQRSGLSPAPKKFSEVLPHEIDIADHEWVVFCKKNSKDLQKLIAKFKSYRRKIVIDDEADYATPNSKINKNEKSKINELTESLIGSDGIYIGVTATPARLDLNRTHNNDNECWVDYPKHSRYTGQEEFFPVTTDELPYRLILLPNQGDMPAYLRGALFSFMVNSAYLNLEVNPEEQNYSMLIHTSGKKADHSVDYKEIVKTFEALRNETHKNHEKYLALIWDIANKRYGNRADPITRYILENFSRSNIVVMNSDKDVNAADNRTATDPTSPFTVVIGGNIVSRGVTFNNLLSMFFTRDVRHNIQQDTYIQRARMFGSRGAYLKYFELTIPTNLYLDWQRCFIFHRLSLESRRSNKSSPVWLEGQRIVAASRSSIDRATVVVDSGEMSFELFDYHEGQIKEILDLSCDVKQKMKELARLLGEMHFPKYLIDFIETYMPNGDRSVAIHLPKSISGYKDASTSQELVARTKGFIGKNQLEKSLFPDATHHIFILFNSQYKARVFYKYEGNISFLKTAKN